MATRNQQDGSHHGTIRGDDHAGTTTKEAIIRQAPISAKNNKTDHDVNHHASGSSATNLNYNGDNNDNDNDNDTNNDNSKMTLFCENRPHPFYQEWNGDECDHESFFCFTEGINNHCCKCRIECCGQCNMTATYNDPYQACPLLDEFAENTTSFERSTQAIVIAVIMLAITFILCICFCLRDHRKQTEKNNQGMHDDEYGNEGRFVENSQYDNDIISNIKSS
ncbi:MAG: hypothetical protein SGBAC_007571 [Bacillariaceae sp.]